jgi:hypothetical protein
MRLPGSRRVQLRKPPERIEIRIASPIPVLARIVRAMLTGSIISGLPAVDRGA